jgi:hypothetical protein
MSSCWNFLELIHDARNDEHKNNLGLRGKRIPIWYKILGGCGLQCCFVVVVVVVVVVVTFMTLSRGGIRPNLSKGCVLIVALPPLNKNILCSFRHT